LRFVGFHFLFLFFSNWMMATGRFPEFFLGLDDRLSKKKEENFRSDVKKRKTAWKHMEPE